jgi:hypothetical protein
VAKTKEVAEAQSKGPAAAVEQQVQQARLYCALALGQWRAACRAADMLVIRYS